MLTELHGKDVEVHLGILAGFTDSVKGKVITTNERWIQVKSKKRMEFISLASVKRITLAG